MNPQNSFRLGVLILLGCISLSLAQQQQMPQCAVRHRLLLWSIHTLMFLRSVAFRPAFKPNQNVHQPTSPVYVRMGRLIMPFRCASDNHVPSGKHWVNKRILQVLLGSKADHNLILTVALNVTNTMCERPIRDRTKISSVLCGITGSLAIIAVILRMINTWQCENFAMDDACALLAGLFVIPENAATFATGPAGFGKDIWTVPFDKITYILKVRCSPFFNG